MKKVACFLFAIILLSGCEELSSLFEKKITIKGKISSASKVLTNRVKSSANSLSLADARKVLAYYGNKYSLANINNGSFSISVPEGCATCLVFLDDDNQYIGNLFAGGLNVLPLVGLGSTTNIDLSTLTLDGTRVIPSNDPVGSTIQISDEEISFMQAVGAYYLTLSKNLDMDNDGSPDVVDGDQIRVNSIVNMFAGAFGTDSKQAAMIDPINFIVNYGIRIAGDVKMYDINYNASLTTEATQGSITLNWDPIKADPSLLKNNSVNEFILVFQQNNPQAGSNAPNTLPFADGIYTFRLTDNRQYTFSFSNIDMQNHMMIIKPTFHTDKNGYISKISYEFIFSDGTPANPHNLIQGYIRTQINDNASQLYEGHPLYGTFTVSDDYDYYNEVINEGILLSLVNQCNFAYIDILGNEYEFSWRKN